MRPSAVAFILLCLLSSSLALRPYLVVITNEDFTDSSAGDDALTSDDSSADWDEFGDPDGSVSYDDHDPGSWRHIFQSQIPNNSSSAEQQDQDRGVDPRQFLYFCGVRGMISAVSSVDPSAMEDAVAEIEAAASAGHPHAQSALGFLYSAGISRRQSRPKSFLYHSFAADGGNMQSKMVLAYTYYRQEVSPLLI